jgi:hydrogenase maturation protease
MPTTLVLGLGDRTRGDDGIGPLVIERLAREYRFDPRIMLLDARTMGVRLLPSLMSVGRVLVVTGVRLDAPPGTVHRLQWSGDADAFRPRLPAFRPEGIELLRTLHFWVDPVPEVVVLGLEVPRAGGAGLRPHTGPALGLMVEAAVEQLRRWGHRLDGIATTLPEPAFADG